MPDRPAADRLAFTKGHGTGNDFVVLADPHGALTLEPALVQHLCDRRTGIGADGLLRAVRVAADDEATTLAAALGDERAVWFMDYRNADGSAAEMCGNGSRVFVAFLLEQGLLELPDGVAVPILTRGGVREVRRAPDGFAVDLGPWRMDGTDPVVAVRGVAVARPGLAISLPNPHVVAALADDDELDGADLSVPPQLEPAPAAGANVELVHPLEPLVDAHGVGRIRLRVHERGVGETSSCGTGAAAAALAVRYWAGDAVDRWRVAVPGGLLGVRIVSEGAGDPHVVLSGPAVLVYSGSIEVPSPALVTSSTR